MNSPKDMPEGGSTGQPGATPPATGTVPGTGSHVLRICVIIPAYNEEETVEGTIRSVLDAGIPPSDICVVDDCSKDRTWEVAAGTGVTPLRNPSNLGKADSIKRALSRLPVCEMYDLIALLDADSEVEPDYFSRIAEKAVEHPEVVLFVGQVKSRKHNWITSSRAFDYTFMHDVYKTAQSKFSVLTVGPGCASVYRGAGMRKIEITSETLAEDMDWTIQVYRKNLGRTLYVPGAVVHTQDPSTLTDYVNQIRRWYVGSMQVIRNHRIPFRLQRIDLEVALLFLEGLLYSTAFALLPVILPLLAFSVPRWIARLALADLAMFTGLATYCAVRTRRADILRNFPCFYVIRYVNACVFLESFIRVYIKREVIDKWYKVSRYRTG